jgi:antitoxin component of RelBE/YafQ-DinJ toxin-antitoxin module
MKRKTMIWSRVSDNVMEKARKLSDSLGISISEYIRQLILRDLEKRSLLFENRGLKKFHEDWRLEAEG